MGQMSAAAAVIGSAGFLGSALTVALERSGVPVAQYTRSVPFLTSARGLDPGLLPARTVFWLASSINPAVAEAEPERIRADRETFTTLLVAAAALPRPPRLVLLSSGGTVYDPAARPPHDERTPTRPRGAYGQAKLELERLLGAAGLPAGHAIVVRASNAYGPGQPALSGQGVIAHWLRAARAGAPLTIYGDPGTTRDFVYVGDLATALVAIHRTDGELPAVINIGSGRASSLGSLAQTVLDVVGDPTPELIWQDARAFDVPHNWLDVRLARQLLGWTPSTPLRAGIEAAWADLRAPRPEPPLRGNPILPGASVHA